VPLIKPSVLSMSSEAIRRISNASCARATVMIVSARATIALEIKLKDHPVPSETTSISAGPYVLVISTVLPQSGLALQIHSTFVGHEGLPTCATHMTLGPVGHDPSIVMVEYDRENLDPITKPRACAYEHAAIVLDALTKLGYAPSFNLSDTAFLELERT
jgi:hypothetical protein